MTATDGESGELFFFESQQWARCAVHCVNNLVQRGAVTHADFDAECVALAPEASRWRNPHRSLIPGVGDYDANVLINVVQRVAQASVRFVDRRQRPLPLRLDDERLVGFVVNVTRSSSVLWRLFGSGKHWFAIARKGRRFALCDSLHDGARPFADDAAVVSFLEALVDDARADANILIVERAAEGTG